MSKVRFPDGSYQGRCVDQKENTSFYSTINNQSKKKQKTILGTATVTDTAWFTVRIYKLKRFSVSVSSSCSSVGYDLYQSVFQFSLGFSSQQKIHAVESYVGSIYLYVSKV